MNFLIRSLFFCIVTVGLLCGEEILISLPETKLSEHPQENSFVQNYRVTPKVNVITGEYLEDECDLTVAASDPLSFRRFYGHFAKHDPFTNFWRFNPEHFCEGNLSYSEMAQFISIGQRDGNVHSFHGLSRFKCTTLGFFHAEISGQSHPSNTKITFAKVDGDVSSRSIFRLQGEIIDGSGSKKKFLSEKHAWCESICVQRADPDYGREARYYEPDHWTPYHLPIYEEKKANGNILCYEYEHFTRNAHSTPYPKHSLLRSITLYNRSKTQVIASLKLNYQLTIGSKKPIKLEVEGSDGRKVHFDVSHTTVMAEGDICKYFSKVSSPSNPSCSYIPDVNLTSQGEEGKRVKKVEWPKGRFLEIEYHPTNGKVSAQYAPIGSKGEKLPISRYVYHSDSTEVFDAENHKTIFRLDGRKRVTSIEAYDNAKIIKIEKFSINKRTGNLDKYTIEDGEGKVYKQIKYQYDANHNLEKESVGNGKEEYTTYRSFTQDGLNLIKEEWDEFNKKIVFSYEPGTNLCTSEVTYEGDQIKKRVLREFNDCAICTKTTIDDGEKGTYRRITEVRPKKQHPCFGLPEIVIEKTINEKGEEVRLSKVSYTYTSFGKVAQENHYDSTNRLCFTLKNEYDERERLKSTKNALGHETLFSYDENNNLISIKGPMAGQSKEVVYDQVNRPVYFKEHDGKEILCVEQRYDKKGNVISRIDACGNKTKFDYDARGLVIAIYHPDGAIEKKEYDPLDNVILERDGKGFVTKKKYDYRKQITEIEYPDGSKEAFIYKPNGTLKEHHDRNGALSYLKTDIFGHVLEVIIHSSQKTILKRLSAEYNTFSPLREWDGKGIETRYRYDFAGRKTEEEKAGKKIKYGYDTLGRICQINDGATITKKEFNFLDQLTKESVYDCEQNLLRTTSYKYDECGNQTQVITSKGVFETIYNDRGLPINKKDPLGNTTFYTYNYEKFFKITETNPKGIKRSIHHDNRGKPNEIITYDAKNQCIQRVEKQYDLAGNLDKERHHLFEGVREVQTMMIRWIYGPMNRLDQLIEEKGKETKYLYDEHGRLSQTIKPDLKMIDRNYDDLGRLKRLSGEGIDYFYEYDLNDRLERVTDSISNTFSTRSYDDLGNLTSDHYGLGFGVTNVYDVLGRRKGLILPDGSEISYTYQGDQLSSVKRRGFEHCYITRDLDGQLSVIGLPSNLGQVTIERDKLGRMSLFKSPFYSAQFADNAYDSCGNLCNYAYQIDGKEHQLEFVYDDLNQLTKENNHSYRFDSLFHRLEKDGVEERFNDLGQIEREGVSYDLCGNLSLYQEAKYTYDILDRVIKVEINGLNVEYQYDAFNRRLSKRVDGKVKELYLWDGENEMGALDKNGNIKELRVLGEGLGAEIGAAVLLELEGETYVPLHDFRGCLISLIDIEEQKTVQNYSYTSFGQEVDINLLSPWRFCGKRVDAETGLVYFGRRYYAPNDGVWLTSDPKGFHDGANLYAYVKNNPQTLIDLYGLEGIFNDIYHWYKNRGEERSETIAKTTHHERCSHYYPEYEKHRYNKSTTYNLDRPKIDNLLFCFINGLNTTRTEMKSNATYWSDITGSNDVTGVYHATQGIVSDICEAALMHCKGKLTNGALVLMKAWLDFFTSYPEGYVLQACHSRGAFDVRNAGAHVPAWMAARIAVTAISPACYIPEGQFMSIRHYRSERDFVPLWFDPVGRKNSEYNTTVLEPHPDAKFFDHSFMSPTYKESLIDDYNMFIRGHYR